MVDYTVMSNGVIISKHSGRQISQRIDSHGYSYVKLNGHKFYVHRLVAEVFLQPHPDPTFRYVGHIDGNRQNNSVFNLEWKPMHVLNSPKGEDHHLAKLTDELVYEIRRNREEGQTIQEIADTFNLGYTTVRNVLTGATWKHVV